MKTWVVLGLLVASASASAQTMDRVRYDVPVSAAGVLVDGQRDGAIVNDAGYTSYDVGGFFQPLFPAVVLDNFTAASGSNEVIVFADAHAPTLAEAVNWTPASNTIDVQLEPAYAIPVYAYIVAEPFPTLRDLAADQAIEAARIFRDERLGVQFERFEIRDRTQLATAPAFYNFDCGLASVMRQELGFEPGAINVYYVSRTLYQGLYSTTAGFYCGNGTVVMARDTSGPLLAHELGHAFSLAHVDTQTDHFDTTNVMHSASNQRRYLTEGQTFRAIFDLASDLNLLYTVRQGQVVRVCPHLGASASCPTIDRRIWSDGSWSAN